jgi:hypothetical protein
MNRNEKKVTTSLIAGLLASGQLFLAIGLK